ncbi:MAG TPA: Flp family type IVb pilin [Propionibacteriaceae bacterium]|jgi:Flp pilus assembly pilin Flp|nr:Flp family type IVb pilin [Propionibacteriaceae bacterium]
MREPSWWERGVTSVEYALMAAIIVLLLVGGAVALFDAVQERFDRDAECAAQAYEDVGC